MTTKKSIPFIKSVCKSGKGYILWIPKDVVNHFSLKDKDIVEVRLNITPIKEKGAPFIKSVCKSGRGYLLWIPKDVVNYISLKDKDIVEVRLKN